MTQETHKELFEKKLIDEKQFHFLDMISNRKIISVYYELRILLYLGVLLFTSGIGILIYKNVSQAGHLILLFSICILTLACFAYAFYKAEGFSKEKISSPTPYFDYILLLGSLLYLTVFGYLQYLYGFLLNHLELSTLVASLWFFFIAYRFDHLGILSLAITSLAAFFGISVSPKEWQSSDFFSSSHLYITGLIFSSALALTALILKHKAVKKHFTFTYLNFCCLIFFISALTGLFSGQQDLIYLLVLITGCILAVLYAQNEKSFLFLLYAFVSGYIGLTYILAIYVLDKMNSALLIWSLYSIISCGNFIYFIIKYKNHFKQKT